MFTKYNFSIAGLLPKDEEALISSAAGLYVSPERTIETDGHQMVIVTAPESQPNLFEQPDGLKEAEYFTPFLMDRESSLKIAKVIPKRNPDAPENSMVMLDVNTESEVDSTVAITESIRRSIFKSTKIDAAKFPDVDAVIPSAESAIIELRFSPDILIQVLNHFKRFCAEDDSQVIIRLFGKGLGMRIDAESCGQIITAVVMPLRESVSGPTSEASE